MESRVSPYALSPPPTSPVAGTDAHAPIGRIFCVGRNYTEHAKEMGAAAEPVFFMKPAQSIVTGTELPYPPDTERLDHEVELAVLLGAGGSPRTEDQARALIYGYAVAIDVTRRDVQAAAKAAGAPWESAKAFDGSTPISPIRLAAEVVDPGSGAIWLDVDGVRRQSGDVKDMTLSPTALIVRLARHWRLAAGDVILTGTPAGVGPLHPGERVHAGLEAVGELTLTVGPKPAD